MIIWGYGMVWWDIEPTIWQGFSEMVWWSSQEWQVVMATTSFLNNQNLVVLQLQTNIHVACGGLFLHVNKFIEHNILNETNRVGGLEHFFIVPYVRNVIIPTDFNSIIFQRGRLKPPTRNICKDLDSRYLQMNHLHVDKSWFLSIWLGGHDWKNFHHGWGEWKFDDPTRHDTLWFIFWEKHTFLNTIDHDRFQSFIPSGK